MIRPMPRQPSSCPSFFAPALLAAALAAAPASAQFVQGPYVAGGLGLNLVPDTDLNLDRAATLGLGGAGHIIGAALRLRGEVRLAGLARLPAP